MAIVDVLDAGLDLQTCVLQPRGQRTILLPDPLVLHQQRETIFESEIRAAGLAALFVKGLEHAEQLHPLEFADGLFIEHCKESFLPERGHE